MLDLNSTMVTGDSRSLRNFFNDLVDSLERAESKMEEVESLENKLDEAIGIEEHRDELLELVKDYEEKLKLKDELILELRGQIKMQDKEVEVPKLPVKKKKIIKKVK